MKKIEDNNYSEMMSPGPIFKKFFILSNKNKITNDYYFDTNNVVFFLHVNLISHNHKNSRNWDKVVLVTLSADYI